MVREGEKDDSEEKVGNESHHHHHRRDDAIGDRLDHFHLGYSQETQYDPVAHYDPHSRYLASIASATLNYLTSMESWDPGWGLLRDRDWGSGRNETSGPD